MLDLAASAKHKEKMNFFHLVFPVLTIIDVSKYLLLLPIEGKCEQQKEGIKRGAGQQLTTRREKVI